MEQVASVNAMLMELFENEPVYIPVYIPDIISSFIVDITVKIEETFGFDFKVPFPGLEVIVKNKHEFTLLPKFIRKARLRLKNKKDILGISEILNTNSTLQTIHLDYNQIGYTGVVAVVEALKTNLTLQVIDLYQNIIGNEGAFAIGEALKTNSTLQTIYLGRNQIGDEGVVALGEALQTNSTLQAIYLY